MKRIGKEGPMTRSSDSAGTNTVQALIPDWPECSGHEVGPSGWHYQTGQTLAIAFRCFDCHKGFVRLADIGGLK